LAFAPIGLTATLTATGFRIDSVLDDPAVVAEIYEYKRRFDGKISESQNLKADPGRNN